MIGAARTPAPATRERVLQGVQELRYRPDLAARPVRTRQTGRLAVVMGIPVDGPVSMLAGAGSAATDPRPRRTRPLLWRSSPSTT